MSCQDNKSSAPPAARTVCKHNSPIFTVVLCEARLHFEHRLLLVAPVEYLVEEIPRQSNLLEHSTDRLDRRRCSHRNSVGLLVLLLRLQKLLALLHLHAKVVDRLLHRGYDRAAVGVKRAARALLHNNH